MKQHLKIFLFFFLVAISFELIAQKKIIDSTIYWLHTAKIQGKKFTAFLTKPGFSLFNDKNDILINIQDDYFDLKFKDFNKDGYLDIYLDKGSNMPEWFDLFLYVPSIKRFRQIDGFNKFPDPQLINSTKYFYSYHRNGCADAYWVSDLFYIKDYKAIKLGSIYGQGCDKKDSEYGVYIYKVANEKKTLLKIFPIEIIDKYKENKWGFIKEYWKKNYRKFL